MRILFVDPACYRPYDPKVLREESLGGTEATVVRVAEGLALRSEVEHVDVLQHNRSESVPGNPGYARRDEKLVSPTHVVVIRLPWILPQVRRRFPQAKLYFWAHDLFSGPHWKEGFRAIVETGALPICVSSWHLAQMTSLMRDFGLPSYYPSRYIYNPIDDDLKSDATPTEGDKLAFFSSPHKGLEHTLSIFQQFRQVDKLRNMRLFISNPGYYEDLDSQRVANVVNLGKLSHREVIGHVRSSFAVLHLNATFPETFGMVHAEANAVGVPFLNASIGATPEICPDLRQFVDVGNAEAVAERLLDWKAHGRPQVAVNPAFRLRNVVDTWMRAFAP
jgi:glycosyltransferase involved in cell wall biosynthesis